MKLLARAALCALAATLLTAASGYQVNYGANQDITEWSTCKNVANNSPTGKAIFVPTNSSTEWSQFYTNGAPGVTIVNCGCTVTAGSQTYSTAGTYTFTVPCHNNLTVEVWGGGAGGSGCTTKAGGAGGTSTWNGGTLTANGGSPASSAAQGAGGAGGTASGGTTNTTGSAGEAGNTNSYGGKGGAGANGGAGGARQTSAGANGKSGTAPGGAGGGCMMAARSYAAFSGGGGGGYSAKTWTAGTYTVGAGVQVIVGAAGAMGDGSSYDGGTGAVGQVKITWN
jgi:hypothetical protein